LTIRAGPFAHMKVASPDGLNLNGNLAELTDIVSEDDTAPSTSIFFYPRRHDSVDTRDDPAVSIGSSSLSEHRKRHGLFYLPTGKIEDELSDYPHANDTLPSCSNETVSDDKSKTVEPVFAGKKSKTTKSRPKVVKLDGEDFLSSMMSTANVPKEDPLSGALRGGLLGRDAIASPSQKVSEVNSEAMLKEMGTNESSFQRIENLGSHPASSSVTSKQNPDNAKESRKHRSSGRSGHRQGKHEHRERSSTQPDIVPQAPVIQDFLI